MSELSMMLVGIIAVGILSGLVVLQQKMHERELESRHIHKKGCLGGVVSIIAIVTHQELSLGTGPWMSAMAVTVVDSETTECSVCHSKTKFASGKDPVSLICVDCKGDGEVPDVGAWMTQYDMRICPRCKGSGDEPE